MNMNNVSLMNVRPVNTFSGGRVHAGVNAGRRRIFQRDDGFMHRPLLSSTLNVSAKYIYTDVSIETHTHTHTIYQMWIHPLLIIVSKNNILKHFTSSAGLVEFGADSDTQEVTVLQDPDSGI